MKQRLRTYTAYSIGCAVVWAIILIGVAAAANAGAAQTYLLVFCRWVIGWLSATIARVVYPPPKQRHRPNVMPYRGPAESNRPMERHRPREVCGRPARLAVAGEDGERFHRA